ncbi:fungal-specific transcription factor domain-containing protein [Calycina marina]|uniref:Fungal-specific transcription factor domain-containing protein n=1 Tax=Calycina marina TaxID=1763456 RepID=A0A9P7Z568_9HELO|nr:fungal-specific transcription factor domain-containing protein [Calycina marina]
MIKRQDNLSSIENRIRQMESVIASKIERPAEENIASGDISKQVGISDNLSMVMVNDKGASQFFGSSSGFSIFSPRGLQWIYKKTHSKDLEDLITEVRRLDPETWDQGSWSKYLNVAWYPLPESMRQPFPTREVALAYVEEYFLSFNSIFPLFNRETFNPRFESQYSQNPPTIDTDVSWYACFNMVLALGSAIISTSYPTRQYCDILESEVPSKYFANATSVFIDLQFGCPNLMTVQAVLAIIFMLQGTPNHVAPYTLASIAARLSHTIGLHRWLDDYGITKDQAEERRNVFWMLYIVDKEMSLQSGRPPIIHDQDIGVALPKEIPNRLFPSGLPIYNTFHVSAKLAMIEGRVYSELYSARARSKSVLQRLVAIGKLDDELQKLRDAVPIKIRPEHKIVCDERQLLPVIMLHHSFYNCLTAIHRVSIFHGPWTSDPGSQNLPNHNINLSPRVYESEAICVEAARHAIATLEYFEGERPPPMIWLAISQPLCGALALFANILQHPEDPNAYTDLNLVSRVVATLGSLFASGRIYMGTSTLWIFQELYYIAEKFLAKEMQSRAAKAEQQQHQDAPPSQVQGIAQSIESLSLPSDLGPPSQLLQDVNFNDDMLMFMGSNTMYGLGEQYETSESEWLDPKDVNQCLLR